MINTKTVFCLGFFIVIKTKGCKKMTDMDYARFVMGNYADDVYSLVRRIRKFNRRTDKGEKEKHFDELLSYYEFDSGDYMVGDILLDRHQIIHDANIHKDAIIALALKGVMVIQRRNKKWEDM